MAEQIVVFKNGERVITTLQEVFEGEGEDKRGVCLLMTHPYILELVSVDTPGQESHDLQVKFSKWCPYSVDYQFRIPYDGIMAIGEPDSGLAQAYLAKVQAMTASQGNEDIPKWEEGQENPNIASQKVDIEAATKGNFEIEGNGAPEDVTAVA